MNERFTKTDAGREEIRNRSRNLSRPARNLLLIMDERHVGENWVQLVHGATMQDLKALIGEGLIEPKAVTEPAEVNRSGLSLNEALGRLSYDQLYSLLTSQAKERLGLFKGYKLILDVEKCSNMDELRALALRFLSMIEEQQGPVVARKMRMALGAAG